MKPIILCALLLIVYPAAAEDFLPLETGNFWSYVGDFGAEEMKVVSEQVPIFQGHPYPIEYVTSPGDQGLINYWTSEPDGGVLLWGFFRHTWGYLYQPPLRVLDAPLYVGKTWTVTYDLYSLPDTVFIQTSDITFVVQEDPVLTVPAGEFPTFGIVDNFYGINAALENRCTLSGQSRSQNLRTVYEWYSQGVGVVQTDHTQLLQLETYTDHPVATEVSSWGAVKALYRGGP